MESKNATEKIQCYLPCIFVHLPLFPYYALLIIEKGTNFRLGIEPKREKKDTRKWENIVRMSLLYSFLLCFALLFYVSFFFAWTGFCLLKLLVVVVVCYNGVSNKWEIRDFLGPQALFFGLRKKGGCFLGLL